MKILIACEFSGIVRDAFREKGHEAMSCDLIYSERPGKHYKGDIFDIINDGWDMMIAHPPCTYLCVTANRVFKNNPERWKKRLEAMLFVYKLMNANIPKICIENPVGVISTHIRPPEQYIQPYQFGHTVSKKTGLWLKNLPQLKPTNWVCAEWQKMPNGKRMSKFMAETSSTNSESNRKKRNRTFYGVAKAMAEQWG
jgi:hypothetical protein